MKILSKNAVKRQKKFWKAALSGEGPMLKMNCDSINGGTPGRVMKLGGGDPHHVLEHRKLTRQMNRI